MSEQTPAPRCMLYGPDAPQGRIFEGAEAIEAAQQDGWVDTPGAVGEAKPAAKKKAPAKKKVAAKKVATDDNSQ